MHASVVRLAVVLAASLFAGSARADVDMTGAWTMVDPFSAPRALTVTQSGSDLTVELDTLSTETGTIDPATGVFVTQTLAGTVTPDGNRFTGTSTIQVCRPAGCFPFSFDIFGQRAATIVCGNGVEDLTEGCDDANAVDGDGCDHGCKLTRCGNGIVTAGEECDDGNLFSGDGCNADCTISRCGDGIRSAAMGELCDDGNAIDGDGCDANCTPTGCGNGIVTTGEACDRGADNGDDCCATACTLVDPDADGVCTAEDECPTVADPLQRDTDGDGVGDACDATPGQAFEVSRVSVKPAGTGSVLHLRARGLSGAVPQGIVFEDADGALLGYLLVAEPGWATLACTTSVRTAITRCRSGDGAIRWRSAAPARPSKTATLVVRSAVAPGAFVPATLPVDVLVSQSGRVHEGRLARCDPRPDRLVCRE